MIMEVMGVMGVMVTDQIDHLHSVEAYFGSSVLGKDCWVYH